MTTLSFVRKERLTLKMQLQVHSAQNRGQPTRLKHCQAQLTFYRHCFGEIDNLLPGYLRGLPDLAEQTTSSTLTSCRSWTKSK